MKVINKSDNKIIGIFNINSVMEEVKLLGYNVVDCEFIKSQSELDRDSLLYLESTDWLVTRHRDQLSLDIESSITNEEYQSLLEKRQAARVSIVDQDALKKYNLFFGEKNNKY
ncbi:hypothetical protein Xmau_04528 [Xenorhabdus mauleonii]|uniref:Uncharacterized protein n=1 Tax=Xenorhabdus mauleonii TaxID=351675 RepID=A0A1I3YSR4_9GAMM|nr:hypothetical protein [Xenorhabdus mauleonii]PHM33428.1 hypothetical protein Xmau_04528 [Xenorhabdus mauleonii]SFK34389.1 hypothetical protein SAMN05421680_1662 [Xenorhabdus mauleonii]